MKEVTIKIKNTKLRKVLKDLSEDHEAIGRGILFLTKEKAQLDRRLWELVYEEYPGLKEEAQGGTLTLYRESGKITYLKKP